jgi:hypothetical protein
MVEINSTSDSRPSEDGQQIDGLCQHNPSEIVRRGQEALARQRRALLQEKLDRAQREIARGGGDLWTPDDSADDIARVMLHKLSVNKAEHVARAMLKTLADNRRHQKRAPTITAGRPQ